MNEYHDRLRDLVKSLTELTKSGKVLWDIAESPTSFIYTSKGGSVILSSVNEDGEPPFDLRVLDPKGVVVEVYRDEHGGGVFEGDYYESDVAELYREIRDAVRPSNPVIDGLLAELRSR